MSTEEFYREMAIANRRIGHLRIGPKPGMPVRAVEPPWLLAKQDAMARGLPLPEGMDDA